MEQDQFYWTSEDHFLVGPFKVKNPGNLGKRIITTINVNLEVGL